jgi:hypothetical protein
VPLTIDPEEHLIEVPCAAWSRPSAPELIGTGLPKLPAPFLDRFIRHGYTKHEQPFLDITVAEAEPEIEPDGVADDLDREAVVLVWVRRWCTHVPSMAHQVALNKPRNKLTRP